MKILWLMTLFFWSTCFVVNAKTFHLVTETYPPYEYQENGKIQGMDIDILNLLSKKAGVTFDISFEPWIRALEMVKSGSVDGIFSIIKNKAREDFLYYPKIPLYVGKSVFFVHPDLKKEIKSMNDLKGLSIGTVRENSYGAEFDSATSFTTDPVTNQEMLLQKLITGRNTIIITTEEVGWHHINKQKVKGFRSFPFVVSTNEYHIAISKKSPNGKELFQMINKAFTEAEQSGELAQIRKQYKKEKHD